jgi:hemolysin-activating ACP:hemolysin acyltransferase
MFWKRTGASEAASTRDFDLADPQIAKIDSVVNSAYPQPYGTENRALNSISFRPTPGLSPDRTPQSPPQNLKPNQQLTLNGTVPVPKISRRPERAHDSVEEAAAAFGKIASVLMRNAETGEMRIADLSLMVAPAVEAGTYAVIDATNVDKRTSTPAAIALWAFVSDAVDQRLSANMHEPVSLAPHEWISGSIPWLVTAAGEPGALQKLMTHLLETRLAGLTLKMRSMGPDGRAAAYSLQGAP